METIKATDPMSWNLRGQNMSGFRPPGGENFRDLANRVNERLSRLDILSCQNVLIITHAGVIRTLVCQSKKISLNSIFTIQSTPGHMTIIDWQSPNPEVTGLDLDPATFAQTVFENNQKEICTQYDTKSFIAHCHKP